MRTGGTGVDRSGFELRTSGRTARSKGDAAPSRDDLTATLITAPYRYVRTRHQAVAVATPASRTRVVVTESNLRGYRGLSLDAFGSLLEGGPAETPPSLDRIVRDHGVALESDGLSRLWLDTIRRHRESMPFRAYREIHRRAFREIFAHLGISEPVDDLIDETFEGYRRAKAFPEVPGIVGELEHDVAIAVVSNMDTKLLLEALQNNGLAFTFVVTSEEEQRYKPAASLFRRAVRYLGLPPEHVLHVGDSYEEDIVGAVSAGMGAIQIRRAGARADPPSEITVVNELRGVRDVIRRSWGA